MWQGDSSRLKAHMDDDDWGSIMANNSHGHGEDQDDFSESSSTSSTLSIPNESIDFTLVYCVHPFTATVEGHATTMGGDALKLIDDTNPFWFLVMVLRTQEYGYIPVDNIETPFERLARLNKHRNVDFSAATQTELYENLYEVKHKPSSLPHRAKSVHFSPNPAIFRYMQVIYPEDGVRDGVPSRRESQEEGAELGRVSVRTGKGLIPVRHTHGHVHPLLDDWPLRAAQLDYDDKTPPTDEEVYGGIAFGVQGPADYQIGPSTLQPDPENLYPGKIVTGEPQHSVVLDDRVTAVSRNENRRTQLIYRLEAAFDDSQKYRRLLQYRGPEAQKLLDAFQTLLSALELDAKFRRNLIVAAQRLSKAAGVYPASYSLQGVKLESEDPIAAGSFADIYKGLFQGKTVCLKVIRIYQTSQVDVFLKHYSAEAILWGQLSHPNLLPIYGLYRYTARICLVSPWMEHGDIMTFLAQHPDECRTLLILDVLSGIAYLHEYGVIHGDLKGVNILISSSRRACLADFGLSAISDPSILHWTSHSSAASRGGSIRWQAPELFDFESEKIVHNSTLTDVYAFACVAYEIYTDTIPFFEIPRDAAVMFKVQSGGRPSKPASNHVWGPRRLTDLIWAVMEACWAEDPKARPTIKDIYDALVQLAEDSEIVDDRPSENTDVLSSAHFREAADTRVDLPDDIESLLD